MATFLHRVSDWETICPPGKIVTILEEFGGLAERTVLLRAIQAAVGCKERRARDFLSNAATAGYVQGNDHPKDSRKKIFKIV